MTRSGQSHRSRVRIPADVDRPDRLLAGLTARQLGILAAAAVLLWAAYTAVRNVVPIAVFGVLAVPVAAGAVGLAVGRVGGQPADRTALAAFTFLRRPRRLVVAPDGIPALPAWAAQHAGRLPGPLRLPLAGVSRDGLVDLGGDGLVAVCRASSVTFALRSPAEQEALVGGFARWLNALAEPVQLLVRATPVDLTGLTGRLVADAPSLPHPGLETAARAHAAFLAGLSAGRARLARQVLVVFRQPAGEHAPARLARRVEEAASGLAAAGISISRLDGAAVVDVLLSGLDPAGARPAGLAPPDQPITGPASLGGHQ